MAQLATAGKVCRIIAIALAVLAATGTAHSALAFASADSTNAAEFAQLEDLSPSELSGAASAAEEQINPLRDSAPSCDRVAMVVNPPQAKSPSAAAPAGLTARIRLFRAAETKPTRDVNSNATSARSPQSLFPPSKLLTALHAPPAGRTHRVMRYEDVARGTELVPVAPPPSVPKIESPPPKAEASPPPPGSAKTPSPPISLSPAAPPIARPAVTTAPPVAQAESNLATQRLPALNRTAPRPQPPAGTRMPQKPIELYPGTGR